jgi:hypothetical protein
MGLSIPLRGLGLRVVLASALALPSLLGRGSAAIDRARSAFIANDLDAAALAYREVIATDSAPADRIEAFTTLASIAWRIHRDTVTAARLLDTMAIDPGGRGASLRERSRMLAGFGQYTQAERAAAEASSVAGPASDSLEALDALATARFRHASEAPCGSCPSADSLAAVVARLHDVVRRMPGSLDPARLLVWGGVLTGDGDAIVDGWRSYYLIATGDSLRGPLVLPRRALETTLTGRHGPLVGARAAATAVALAASGFLNEAALVARHRRAQGLDNRLADIVAYHDFVDTLVRTTNEYYRQIALGRGDSAAWRRDFKRHGLMLWSRLTRRTPTVPIGFDSVTKELDRRFGAVVEVGITAGKLDLHMGHRVVDDRRTVRQYGHEATVRLVVLDGMVSDGYQTWAWDGRASHGGWANENLIVEVRAGYVSEPIQRWRGLTDPTEVAKQIQRIAADSAADVASAREHPAAYFASVAERLQRDGMLALLDSLKRSGQSGPALEAAFEREYGRALVESSIFAHEGRHAIDRALGVALSDTDLEFRAKLAEVAFAPRPRLALEAIISPNIGDASPHGQANARIMQGLLAWLAAHASEIGHCDPRAPLLPQLPLMTDDQLRQAFASMDPFATH